MNEMHQRDCRTYLEGDLVPGKCLLYPLEDLSTVVFEAGLKNEMHVQINIVPWTVISIYNLWRSKEMPMDYTVFEEQRDTLWSECETMGGSQPKPDYVAGLSQAAFTAEDLEEIKRIYTRETPIRVNPGLLMPFAICEVKEAAVGIAMAEDQNKHAGAIIVRAIFNLFMKAYAKNKPKLLSLCGQVLVWTIDMNHENVNIYGHYGRLDDPEDASLRSLQIYRHRVKDVRLHDEKERFIPYNFMRNMYKDFVPIHITRIRDALSQIKENRDCTGLSFGASAVSLADSDSSGVTAEKQSVITPFTEASIEKLTSIAMLDRKFTTLMEQLRQQREESQAQLERQREESQAQLERQREEYKIQMASLREIIDLLKRGSST